MTQPWPVIEARGMHVRLTAYTLDQFPPDSKKYWDRREPRPWPVPRFPGVKVTPQGTIIVPENCWPLYRGFLEAAGERFEFRPFGPGIPDASTITLPGELSAHATKLITDTPYQYDAFRHGCSRSGTLLTHSPGAGKTLTAFAWLLAYSKDALFVTTAAAKQHIYAQARQHTQCEPVILAGEKPEKIAKGSRIYIITYTVLPAWLDMLRKLRPGSVVFDEIHSEQGVASSKRRRKIYDADTGKATFQDRNNVSSACEKVSRMADRRMGLTASLVRYGVRDVWAPCDLIEPGQWGPYGRPSVDGQERTPGGFTEVYCNAAEDDWGGWNTKGRSNESELAQRLSVVAHSVPYSVTHAGLPPKRREVVRIPLEEQNQAGDWILKELKRSLGRGNANAYREVKLAEAASRKRVWIAKRTIEKLLAGKKVVLFTGRRRDVEVLWDAVMVGLVEMAGGVEDVEYVPVRKKRTGEVESVETSIVKFSSGLPDVRTWGAHGGDSDDIRYDIACAHLQTNGPALLVATLDSMGESIELQRTDWMCFAMLPEKPSRIIQGEGRGARKGQDRALECCYPVALRTYDEHVASSLLDKLPAVELITGDTQVASLIPGLSGTSDPDKVFDEMYARVTKEVMEQDARRLAEA